MLTRNNFTLKKYSGKNLLSTDSPSQIRNAVTVEFSIMQPVFLFKHKRRTDTSIL